jgi:hypothetical protein
VIGARLAGALATAAALAALCAPPALAQNLVAEYRFEDSRASSVGTAPEVTDVVVEGNAPNAFATETVNGSPRRVLQFPQGNGLTASTSGVIPTTSYSIVVLLRFADVAGFRRIVDFQNGSSDTGLYNFSGSLSFFGGASGTDSPITPSAGGDPYHEVMITRDAANEVVGYVDGAEQFRFDDSTGLAVIHPGQSLRFFADDASLSGEESAGAVARISLYDGPLRTPPPTLGENVGAAVVSGTVRLGVPSRGSSAHADARAAQKGVTFVPLTEARRIPVGSFLDTRRGAVRVVSARDTAGNTQTGTFSRGLFQVLQSRRRSERGLTTLALKGSSFRRCARRGRGKRASASASIRRRLRANARGRFRTRGRHSAATVRGTVWLTADRCDGTLTRVTRGRVAVRDFRRKRTVIVRAGKSYLARARRR